MLDSKKALLSAFFIALAFANPTEAACIPTSRIESVEISKVVDGDTVKLTTGRSVRLLGINTPELNKRTGHPEPFAEQAYSQLQMLARDKAARIALGVDPEDHYKRLLAHLLLDNLNAAEQLLEQGLGWAIVIEPNSDQAECLFAAEARARSENLGVWSLPTLAAAEIDQGGFVLTRGRVTRIDATPKYIYLELDDHLALRLTRKQFGASEVVNFGQSLGKQVEARGWVIDRRSKLKPNSQFKGFLLPIGSRWHLRISEG